MKLLSMILIVLSFGTEWAHSQAQEFPESSGNAFVRLCSAIDKEDRTSSDLSQVMACVGYVSGFENGVEFGADFVNYKAVKKIRKPFCRPLAVENGQLVRVLLKYIRENPEKAHEPTSWLMMDAFGRTYPCE